MTFVPQTAAESCTVIRFCVKNQGPRTWFEHEIDLMTKKGNGLEDMSDEINDRRNKFAFLVFKKLEEETGSWLEGNGGSQYKTDIKDIHDRARKIKDKIQREYSLKDNRVGKYEKQVPAIRVSVSRNFIRVASDDWFDVVVSRVGPGTIDVDHLHGKIKECFGMFAIMVRCKLRREINNTLLGIEKAFFRDMWLTAVKTNFERRITVPAFELKKWVERVSAKTDSNGRPNPDYIPGMDVLASWDLTMTGPFVQTYVTKTLHDGRSLKVLGVENQPWHPGTNPNTGKPYDADIWLECDGEKIPVQVGVREGELARKVSEATVCPGEEIQPNEAVSKEGGTNMDYGKKPDFAALREKLEQVPPAGVVLWVSSKELLPGSGPRQLKEWYGETMDKKCVIVWVSDEGKAVIHHNNTGFDLTLARKLCVALGVAEPDEQTDFEDSLTEDYAPDDVEGALKHLAYMSSYLGRRSASAVVLVDDLVPILRHVVEMYMKSAGENADDGGKWKCYVEDALSVLERVAKADNIKLDTDVWVEICRILQDIASRRDDDNCPCETLSFKEIGSRLHLWALFCLTYMVIYRLGNKTPPEVRETLTAAARLDGQKGKGHRIVLGFALWLGLRYAIPDWYAENEELLFGKDSPDGMNSTLVRVCSHEGMPIRTDIAHSVLDVQIMEKYHTVVLGALCEEMQHVRSWESKTGERAETNDLVRRFMRHVLYGSRGYEIADSVQNLASIGPDAVSVAGHECGFLIHDENAEEKLVKRAVHFWEAVLDSAPEPAALYGFGWWEFTKSVDQDTWERLMLRTCEAAGGLVEAPAGVIRHASPNYNPTEAGIRIIELVLCANMHLLGDLAVSDRLSRMLENGVSIDIVYRDQKPHRLTIQPQTENPLYSHRNLHPVNTSVLIDHQLKGWAAKNEHTIKQTYPDIRYVEDLPNSPSNSPDHAAVSYCIENGCDLLTTDETAHIAWLDQRVAEVRMSVFSMDRQVVYCLAAT